MVKDTLHDQAPSQDERFTQYTLMVAACKAGDADVVQRLIHTDGTLVT
jgi:hypothetical protein